MGVREFAKWFYVAKGLEKCGLLKSSEWKTVKVVTKSYQNELVEKVIREAEKMGRNS